ncbi:glutamine synthetase family protein [Algirhabdus cladophorae]|uniref:glutamine synthetase family protein n=1 Tax=Algirhabdus cladophorae TaxID=3377108 RepID=UPI003B847D64
MDLTQLQTFRVAAVDLNGQLRGKRVPSSYAGKLEKGAVRLPVSTLNMDISGADIEGSPLVYETGDADGILLPTSRGPVPMPWLERPSALVPMWMFDEAGQPFAGDPRHALARVLDRFDARDWQVVAATELEFYLVDRNGLRPPIQPKTGEVLSRANVYGLSILDGFEAFFDDLYDACEAMEIPAQTALAESGLGQFEVNLNHQDAMKAADDAMLFKTLVKGLARKHGLCATFMAKPYETDAGNGLHVHFSVLDKAGQNVFDDGTDAGTDVLRYALAGCLDAMQDCTLLFAPHAGSYHRLVPNAHAPTAVCWGYENRTVALRVPGGPPVARRIEHRVAGGDINPYLMLAAILGAAMNGVDDARLPPAPIIGSAYDQSLPQLAPSWSNAIDRFASSPHIARIFDPMMIDNMVRTKRQDMAIVSQMTPIEQAKLYLETV